MKRTLFVWSKRSGRKGLTDNEDHAGYQRPYFSDFVPARFFRKMLLEITEHHTLVLSSFVVTELKAVVERKFPEKREAIDSFLSMLSYELVYSPDVMEYGLFEIRDPNDYPVLYSAMLADAVILITGDADFRNLGIERPIILTQREFIERYG